MPRALDAILSLTDDSNIVVPPLRPYSWSAGVHDISLTLANAPLIGMAYVFEGDQPPEVTPEEYEAARVAATAEGSTDAAYSTWVEAQVTLQVSELLPTYSNWFLMLVACEQIRPLTSANLANFCSMSGARPLPSAASAYLKYWAANSELIVDEAAVRTRFIANKFFEYHTTGSSTPALAQEAMHEARGLALFSEAEGKLVSDACEEAHDIDIAREIPSTTLVKVRAVHEAAGTLPDPWYMGERAVQRFSSKKYSALVKYLKAIFAKQTDVAGIEERDLPTLVTQLAALIATFGEGETPEAAAEADAGDQAA